LQYVTAEFGIINSSSGPNRGEMLLPEEVEDLLPTVDCGSTGVLTPFILAWVTTGLWVAGCCCVMDIDG
jgi:hypothetical protein